MKIDLTSLLRHTENEIDISGDYDIPNDIYKNSDILELKKVKVCGKITLVMSEDDPDSEKEFLNCSIETTVIIRDSISLDPIEYEISTEYDDFIEENYKSSENSLDIFQFLWENILLEVPLQYTKVEDLKGFHGDGWKLISEEELDNSNNPFKDLLNDFKKE